MNNVLEYIDLNVNCDKENLHINEQLIFTINIKNKSNIRLENGLFMLALDTKIFDVLDENFKICIDDFGSIGNIEPLGKICFNIKLRVKEIPKELFSTIFYRLNFHVVKNSNLVDLSYKSDIFKFKFIYANVLDRDCFIINSKKEEYIVDEAININIFVNNKSNYDMDDLIITNFITPNVIMDKDSFTSSLKNITKLKDDYISIKKLKAKEKVYINFDVYIKSHENIKNLQISASMKYQDRGLKEISLNSNQLNININNDYILSKDDFVYTLDKNEFFLSDIITHNVFIKNNTTTSIMNLELTGNFDNDIEFIENSLIINDVYRIGENIKDEIRLGELDENEELYITFKTKIYSLYYSDNISFDLKYNTSLREIKQKSNCQIIKINAPRFDAKDFIKTSNKEKCYIDDVVEFRLEFINTGNIPCKKVFIKDNIPIGLKFLDKSLYINEEFADFDIVTEGIVFSEILPNQKILIKYSAKAIDLCNAKNIKASLLYNIKNDMTDKIESNGVDFNVVGAKIGSNNFKKELSTYTCQIGDMLTYLLTIENTGNVNCENLKIYEVANKSIEFIDGCFLKDDIYFPIDNIFEGVNINNLDAKEIVTLKYQMKIVDFPRPNPIDDRSILEYTFIVNNELKTNTIYSNRCKLYVNNANISIIDKNAYLENDKYIKYCYYGDTIFFNLLLENKGNVGLENIKLNISMPKDLQIEEIKINNFSYAKDNLENINLPNLNVSQKISIEFYVKHMLEDNYNLQVLINVDYMFKDLMSKKPFYKNKTIKEIVNILNPDIQINKFISDTDIEVDKEFTKNINIKNTGNILLENIQIDLKEPEFLVRSKNATFINGCYLDDGDNLNIQKLDVDEIANIAIRYKIEKLPIGEALLSQSEVTANYSFLNNKNFITIRKKSNFLKLNIKNYSINLHAKTSSNIVMLDNKCTYILTINNNGNVYCDNLDLSINVHECIEYIDNSFMINGKKIKIKDLSSPINVGYIKCNETMMVSFDFYISYLPYKNKVKLSTIGYGGFDIENVKKTFISNESIIDVQSLSIDIVKNASSEYLQNGDILSIQTIINNIGTIDIYDVILKDNIDENLIFVEGSCEVDGANLIHLNPVEGINFKNINNGENVILKYEYEYSPRNFSNKIIHYSDLLYYYSNDIAVNAKSNVLYIDGALATFKQFNIENEYFLREKEPLISDIVNISTYVKIDDFYEVKNSKDKYISDDDVLDKKIIIKGFIFDKIEYIPICDSASLYMLERNQPFTVFINIPRYSNDEDIFFKAKCEDTFYKLISDNSIFISNLISIEGLA